LALPGVWLSLYHCGSAAIIDLHEASRMVAIGHLLGYIAGTIDLVNVFGKSLGETQFKQMTIIAGAALLLTVAVTCYSVQERVLISDRLVSLSSLDGCYSKLMKFYYRNSEAKPGAFKTVSMILSTAMHLPRRIQAICWVQFWAWVGMNLWSMFRG
jgi:solute carrier family 45, member 1/2/4